MPMKKSNIIKKMEWMPYPTLILTITLLILGYGCQPVSKNKKRALIVQSNMVWIDAPPKTYQMGDTFGEGYEKDEKQLHSIQLQPFWMDRFETTFAQYDSFCAATQHPKPLSVWGRKWQPVMNVSWWDALEYANWRSAQAGRQLCYTIEDKAQHKVICHWTANGFRLPTEAEWEYAAAWNPEKQRKMRFGNGRDTAKITEMNFDNSYEEIDAWYKQSQNKPFGRNATAPVHQLRPNGFGLYNMSGNVWEWCWDWYAADYDLKQNPPTGAPTGSERVIRGGSWGNYRGSCRASFRGRSSPTDTFYTLGFRLVTNQMP
jgi:formylglycine-generating enzyme required for sulfatase activity